MVTTRLIKEIIHSLLSYKVGLLGLIMVIIEIGLISFFPWVANPADIDNWNNFDYWERVRMTPKNAPPAWVNWFDPNAPPPTTELEPEIIYEVFDFRNFNEYLDYKRRLEYEHFKSMFIDQYKQLYNQTPSEKTIQDAFENYMRSVWESEKASVGKVVIIRAYYVYDFNANKPPVDIRFRLRLNLGDVFYSNDPFWRQGLGVYIHRPDGITISLVPGYSHPTNPYDINQYPDARDSGVLDILSIPRSYVNGSLFLGRGQDWFFSLNGYVSRLKAGNNPFAYGNVLEPILREANETFDPNTYVDMLTVLFDVAAPGVVSGRSGVLKGSYTFEIVFYLKLKPQDVDANPSIENVKFMVTGTYGLIGTDFYGRDLWSGIVYGIGWALFLGVAVSVLTNILGAIYGTVSGYYGGRIDAVMQQIAKVYVSVPAFPLLLLLMWIIGRSIWLLLMYLVVFGWIGGQFTIRSIVLQIREQTYVEAARALGASHTRIVFRYVFPQLVPLIFVSIALSVPGAILTEAGLSFLGLGDPNTVTWGRILEEASNRGAFLGGQWWWIVTPGLAIAFTSLAFILFGQALEKIIAPKLKTL